jgi:geranylgeranyl reductase family protein
MADRYDALVVGGGPGGAAAAYHLSTAGASVLLVEKTTYPREKVCGDGLAPRSVGALDAMGLTNAYADWPRNAGLRVHGSRGRVFTLPWPEVRGLPAYGLTQARIDLDELLAKRAVEAGTTLLTSTDAVRPVVEDGVVTGCVLAQEGDDPFLVRADVVIAADGSSSRIGQALGHDRNPRRPMAVAIRQYFRSPRDRDPWLDSYLELRSGDELLPGYGWVFPMGDGTVNVGLGMLSTSKHFKSTNYRDLLASWATEIGAEWGYTADDAVAKPRSASLPMAGSRFPALHRGVLFVGDAAGVVNPGNGEGIAYAMESGQLAAGAAMSMLQTGDRAKLAEYPKALTERYGSYFTIGRVFAKLIGDPRVMKLCVHYGLEQRTLMRLVLKLLGNLYEPRGGDLTDRVVQALVAMTPAR